MKKIKEAYWLCSTCATENGGVFPDGHVCTVISGKCSVCNSGVETTLIPWVDFDWPKSREEDAVAKIARD